LIDYFIQSGQGSNSASVHKPTPPAVAPTIDSTYPTPQSKQEHPSKDWADSFAEYFLFGLALSIITAILWASHTFASGSPIGARITTGVAAAASFLSAIAADGAFDRKWMGKLLTLAGIFCTICTVNPGLI
jgi:hypothetical protein